MSDREAALASELSKARDEIAALKARIAELSLAGQTRSLAERTMELLPLTVYVYDVVENRNIYSSRSIAAILGYTAEQIRELGSNLFATLMHPEDLSAALDHHARVAGRPDGEFVELTYRFRHADGTYRWLLSQDTVFTRDPDGNALQILGIVQDVTVRYEQEVEARRRADERERELVEAQQLALRELGTPLIPIADEVVAMPLVGTIDRSRAQMILETLLKGIVAQRAAVAILDVTGVKAIDSEVANALVGTAKAARMLGADVILTGIGPEPAQTLVELGLELEGIRTRGTFQSGIAAALKRVRRARRQPERDSI